jgi:hypothetical protein
MNKYIVGSFLSVFCISKIVLAQVITIPLTPTPPKYKLVMIGSFEDRSSGTNAGSEALTISDDGNVYGWTPSANNTISPFSYLMISNVINGGFKLLNVPVSNMKFSVFGSRNGIAVGGTYGTVTSGSVALIWRNGSPSVIPGLAHNSFSNRANDVNNLKSVIGSTGVNINGNDYLRGFIYENNSTTLLPVPNGKSHCSASSINDYGVIAGWCDENARGRGKVGVLWEKNNAGVYSFRIPPINLLGSGTKSTAVAINDKKDSVVVGQFWLDFNSGGYLLKKGVVTALPTLGGTTDLSNAYPTPLDINDSEIVVGAFGNPQGYSGGALWMDGKGYLLQTLVSNFAICDKIQRPQVENMIKSANSITNKGWIAVNVHCNGEPYKAGVLIPEEQTMVKSRISVPEEY